MTFHVYAVLPQPVHTLTNTGSTFSLAGANLLRQAWNARNCPVNAGWNVTANEMIQLLTGGAESYKSRHLIIDYHPSNMSSKTEMMQAQRDALKARIVNLDYGEEFVEFLYLQGNWNWGRNGSTNAAFIQGAARDYFRQYF